MLLAFLLRFYTLSSLLSFLSPSLPLFLPPPSVSFPLVDAPFFSSFERYLAFALFAIKYCVLM